MQLATAHILDCQGRTTHVLTLEIDGTVTIAYRQGGHTVRVDPRSRTVLTPGAHVPDALMDEAASLRP